MNKIQIGIAFVALSVLGAGNTNAFNGNYEAGIEAADFLANENVIVDKGNNTSEYNIETQITRREMLKVMMNISGDEVEDTCSGIFVDLEASDYGCKYAEAAVEHGFIAQNTFFRPNDAVSKSEALKMIMQARGIPKSNDELWQVGYMLKALQEGLIDTPFNLDNSAAARGGVFDIAARSYDDFDPINQFESYSADVARMVQGEGMCNVLIKNGKTLYYGVDDNKNFIPYQNENIDANIAITDNTIDGVWNRTTYPNGTIEFDGNRVKIDAGEGQVEPADFVDFTFVERCYPDTSTDDNQYSYIARDVSAFAQPTGEINEATELELLDIYLRFDSLEKEFLIDSDYAFTKMDQDIYDGFDIPADAIIAFNTYYAGGGNYYYAVVDGNTLKVYKKFLEESTPENEGEEVEEFTLFKEFDL